MKSKLSVLGGLYIIIIDTFLFELSYVLSISIIILLKIELSLISFLRVKVRLSAMKRETPPPVLFGLILYQGTKQALATRKMRV